MYLGCYFDSIITGAEISCLRNRHGAGVSLPRSDRHPGVKRGLAGNWVCVGKTSGSEKRCTFSCSGFWTPKTGLLYPTYFTQSPTSNHFFPFSFFLAFLWLDCRMSVAKDLTVYLFHSDRTGKSFVMMWYKVFKKGKGEWTCECVLVWGWHRQDALWSVLKNLVAWYSLNFWLCAP